MGEKRGLVPIIPDSPSQDWGGGDLSMSAVDGHIGGAVVDDGSRRRRKRLPNSKRKRMPEIIIVEKTRERSPPPPAPFQTPKRFKRHLRKLSEQINRSEVGEGLEEVLDEFIWAIEYCQCQEIKQAHVDIITRTTRTIQSRPGCGPSVGSEYATRIYQACIDLCIDKIDQLKLGELMKIISRPEEIPVQNEATEKPLPLSEVDMCFFGAISGLAGLEPRSWRRMAVDFYHEGRWHPGRIHEVRVANDTNVRFDYKSERADDIIGVFIIPGEFIVQEDFETLENLVQIAPDPTLFAPFLSRSKQKNVPRQERKYGSKFFAKGLGKRIRDGLKGRSDTVIPLGNLLNLPRLMSKVFISAYEHMEILGEIMDLLMKHLENHHSPEILVQRVLSRFIDESVRLLEPFCGEEEAFEQLHKVVIHIITMTFEVGDAHCRKSAIYCLAYFFQHSSYDQVSLAMYLVEWMKVSNCWNWIFSMPNRKHETSMPILRRVVELDCFSTELMDEIFTGMDAELQRGEQGDSMIILDSVCRLLRSANQDVYLEHLAELLNEVSTSDLMDPKKYGILEEYIKYNFHILF